ncbi:MAG: chloride channel protein [Ruminococcus sp.]|jgi:H+/Cl- antiporter ClcA|nr:chloride channel protein [Ruminococcus sp.]
MLRRFIRRARTVGALRAWEYLIKWLLISVPCGVLVGLSVSLFRFAINSANSFRPEYRTILLPLLPVVGIVIVYIYRKAGFANDNGTNDIVAAAHDGTTSVEWKKAPLVFAASVLTHLTGGSAGCEGASLQIGGGVLAPVSGLLKMGKNDSSVLMMTAIASAFSALTGAPAASAIFAVEIAIVGSIQYSALLPCVAGAVTAFWTTRLIGLSGEAFVITGIPTGVDFVVLGKVAVIGIFSAITAIAFCRAMEQSRKLYTKYLKNPYIRIIVGGLLVSGIIFLLGTDIYSGAGYKTIHAAFVTTQPWYVFILKLILTALTLAAGFRGGEILPTFFIGATMGSAAATLLGLDTSFGAALGYAAVFCGVTNCPLAAFALAAEIFMPEKGSAPLFFGTAIVISYLLSGYVGLYPAQVYYQTKMRLRRYKRADMKDAEELDGDIT